MAPKIKRLLLKSSWYRGDCGLPTSGYAKFGQGCTTPPIVLVLVLVIVLDYSIFFADHD